MAERWSPEEGLGGGSGKPKTSSGRAGSSGFSGVGNGPGGTGARPAGVQSRDPYIVGVLRGVAPERHREVLQREAQRLTDASAGYEGQINQRRAEKYRDEDPQIQGWLGLIRGTDAQLRANGGKPLPGTLNDRVQRIQSALGEPLRLVPRPGVQPKPAGVQPAGGQPVRPKQGPAPKGVDRVVSAPRGYVASALQSMPAGQPMRPGAGSGARGPMPVAPGQANRAPQQGGQPITNPRQQSGAFTQVGGRPETGWMKQAREDLVGAQARPLGATTLSQLLGTFEGPPQIGVGVTPPKSGMGTDPRKQQTQGPEAKKAAPGSRAREAAAQGQLSGSPSPRRQRDLPDHLNRGSVRGSNSGRGPQEALPGGPGVSLRSARWTSGEDAGVPFKPATPEEKAYVKAHPPILSQQERERRNRAELAKYSDQGRHTFQRPVSAGSSQFYGAPPITETVLSEREQRVAGEGKFSVYDPFRGGVAGAEHPLEGVGRSFAGLVTGEHNEEVAKTRELYQRAQLEGKIPAAPLLAGPGEKNWEIRRQLQVRQLNRLKGSVNRFFHDVLEPVSNPHEFDYAQHGEGVAMAPRNPQQVAKEEAAVRQGFTPEKFEQWAKQNKIVLTPYQRQAVEHLMGARLLEEKRFGPELKALVIGLNVSALAGLGEGKLAAETEALTAKGVTKLSSGLGKTVGKVAPELGESLGKLGPRAVQAVDRFTAEGTPKLLRHAAGVGAEFGGLTPVLNRLLSGKSAEAVSREKNKWVGLAKEARELGQEGGTGAALGWLTGFGLGVVGIPAGKAGDVVLSSAEQAWANRLLRRQVTKLEQQLTQAEARLAELDPRSRTLAERRQYRQIQAQISALNGELAHLKVGQGEPLTPARAARTETVPVRAGLQWPEGVSAAQPDPSFRPGATPVSPGRKGTVKGTGKAAPPLEAATPPTAPRPSEIPTAPEQMPGAVGVSGEPAFTERVLLGLAQTRREAQARIAARRPRKAPLALPRPPKGSRRGAVIGPDVVLAEVGDLVDQAIVGATLLAEGVLNPKVWDLQMVKAVGNEYKDHLEQIRELARRIHQGWKEHRLITQGPRVPEAARVYLEKLAANAAVTTDAPRAPAKATVPALWGSNEPDARLVRDGKLVPAVEQARQEALARLKRGPGQWQYGVPDSATFRDYVHVGATYMAEGLSGRRLRDAWKERMLAELGSEVAPHLDWIGKTSENLLEKQFVREWTTLPAKGVSATPKDPLVPPGGGVARPGFPPVVSGNVGKANAQDRAIVRPLGRPLSSNKREVTDWKRRMKERNYPPNEVEAGIARYVASVRRQYPDLVRKDNVFIPMPSTTGVNTVPETLARHLAKAFGGEVLSGEHIHPVHIEERKELSLFQRFLKPAEYQVTTDLSHLDGKNVVIVDDILTSGDSTEGLRYALRQQGIRQIDLVTLASSGRAANPAELGQLGKRIAEMTGRPETVVKKLVEAQLKQAPYRLVVKLFEKAEDPRDAAAIYRRLVGKRTSIPGNGG